MSCVDVSEVVVMGLSAECVVAVVVQSIFDDVMGVVGLACIVDVTDMSSVVGVADQS